MSSSPPSRRRADNSNRQVDDADLLRYSRQILLPEIGIEGQQRLLEARVLILGMGGLGCPVATYLATSGVGELELVDPDQVDLSNLQRQILHGTPDLGVAKVQSARRRLQELNPRVRISTHEGRLEGAALLRSVRDADVVVDATDNFGARLAINRACVKARRPLVSGAVIRLQGQLSSYRLDQPSRACFACLHGEVSEAPERCSENGVLSAAAGVIGTLQAAETLKLLAGFGAPLDGRLMLVDLVHMEFHTVPLNRSEDCPVCGVGDAGR